MTRLCERLYQNLGSDQARYTLMTIDQDLADRLDARYEAEYDAAPEEDHSGDDPIAIALNPNYVKSKAQVIDAWAGEIVRCLEKAYVEKLGEDGMKALSKLASLDGMICPAIRIAYGVELPLQHLNGAYGDYLP